MTWQFCNRQILRLGLLAFCLDVRAQDQVAVSDSTLAVAPAIPAVVADPLGKSKPPHQFVKWNDGLFFESEDGSVRAHLGALIQQDWTAFGESQSLLSDPTVGDIQDGVFFRRGRILFDGKAYGILEWDVNLELIAQSSVTFDDLWFGLTQLPVIGNARMGHVKIPMGLESVTSNRVLTFLERSSTFDAFWQEYDPGILIFNQWGDGAGTWAACFHRIDDQTDTADFGDGEYAGTVRATWLPMQGDDDTQLLHFGGAYQVRDAKLDAASGVDVVRFRARPEIRNGHTPGVPRFVDTGLIGASAVHTLSAETALIWGPFSVQAEYAAAMVDSTVSPVVGGTARGTAMFQGWYAQVSYFLTGESRVYDRRLGRFGRVKPKQNLWTMEDDGCGQKRPCWHAGAWELAARYSVVDLNDSGIFGGVMRDTTLGLNWHWNVNTRLQANYIYTERDVTAPRNDGVSHEFGLRFSLDI